MLQQQTVLVLEFVPHVACSHPNPESNETTIAAPLKEGGGSL